MKAILLSVILTIFSVTPIFSFEAGKSVPVFMITKVTTDNTLSNREAAFVFRCKNSENTPINTPIKYSANGENRTAKTNSNGEFNIKLTTGKYKFQFFLDNTHYEIYSDTVTAKNRTKTEVSLYFKSSEILMIEDKPVIYFYPEQKTKVNVKLELKGEILFTYPTYNNGWEIEANPDGTLKHNNKEYNYLFWEGQSKIKNSDIKLDEGYIVKKDELLRFFEEKLTSMGLNTKEQQDFITYWFPRMSKNSSNYIHFLFNDDFAKYAQLNINPKPDNMFRVFMIWSKTDSNDKIYIKPQKMLKVNRSGFTVIEWGGTEINIYQEESN